MSLIAILVSLVLERLFTSLHEYRQFGWFDDLTDKLRGWCAERGWQGPGVILMILAGPLLVVILFNYLLDDLLLGLLSLLFNIAVLFLCLGPRDLEQQSSAFLEAWEAEDEERSRTAAADLLGDAPPEPLHNLQQSLVERILLASNERILSPLILYTVFAMLGAGPLGAVLYRASCHLKQRFAEQSDAFSVAVHRLYAILGWLPGHIVPLLFAMAGSFVDVIHLWRERSAQWREDWEQAATSAVLISGLGALQMPTQVSEANVSKDDIPKHVRAAMGLMLRSTVILVVLIALLTLAIFGV